jgi:hypothetical protein
MDTDDKLKLLSEKMTASSLAHQASLEALADFSIKMAEQLNIKEMDGIPLDGWIQKRKEEKIESILTAIENTSPDAAATLRRMLGEKRNRGGRGGGLS